MLNLVVPSTAFEKSVDCGQQVPQEGSTALIATNAVFFRGENAVKPGVGQAPCADVGVSVDIRTGGVFWDNSSLGVDGSAQAVRGTMTIDWTPVSVADAAKLNRWIDYDGDGLGEFTASLWCVSFASTTDALTGKVTLNGVLPEYPGVSQPTVVPAPLTAPTPRPTNAPGAVYIDGKWRVPWCLVSDSRVLQGSTISQTEVLFGSGDPLRK